MRKFKILLFLILILPSVLLSQERESFNAQEEFYLNGDAMAIGNNILSKHATQPFNNSRVQNNDVYMTYVDVDNDDATFSSSSAILTFPKEYKEIAYAGLYWSGTYSVEEGAKKRKGGDYVYTSIGGERADNFNKIKFKMPNKSYKNITGKVLFDGFKNEKYKKTSPYVCYADVTSRLKSASKLNGLYTVANVKASIGSVPGGSSAGWLLYVVYKSSVKKPKHIKTYHGFRYVKKNIPRDVKLDNHKSTKAASAVTTSVVIAAIDGDATLNKDECAVYLPKKNIYIALRGRNRKNNNFFNSTISTNTLNSINRKPGSKNTLGYDLAEVNLPYKKSDIINRKTNQTVLRFKTNSDEYFVFFTAFKTEIDNASSATNNNEESNSSSNDNVTETTKTKEKELDKKNTAKPTPKKAKAKAKKKQVSSKNKVVKSANIKAYIDTLTKKIAEEDSKIITDIKSGYYVVSNVVEDEQSAQKSIKELGKSGFKAKRFKMPYEKSRYVYTFVSIDLEKALEELLALQKKTKFKSASILKVNME